MKLNRISLNTIGLNRIGLNRIGSPSRGASSGFSRPYIDPEVLASLVGVWECDGKTNYDPDRNIIKNKLPGRGGDFEILNAAYKLNSGFGKYEVDFTDKAIWSSSSKVTKVDSFSFQFNSTSPLLLHVYYSDISKDIPSFKIKVENDKELFYYYIDSNGNRTNITMQGSGEYTIPYSHVTLYTGDRLYLGFTGSGLGKVTQIPSFQGAFVTDGVDDTIVSQKTLSEMLGGSNKCTIVSLITHISGTGKYNIIGDGGIQVSDYSGQTFMAGASSKSGEKIVELGDKEKLKALQYTTFDSKISIGLEDSSYAYYGTFIFNKDSVPIDWIHQVIAYFNLDKHVEPTVYYNVPKQGLTNDTPLADWYLKDFSGNGRDMQLYNYAKSKDSGIGKYGTDYTKWTKVAGIISTKDKIVITKDFVGEYWLCFIYTDVPAYKVRVSGLPEGCTLEYQKQILVNGINELHALEGITSAIGFTVNNIGNVFDLSNLVIEQIPDYEGALVSDGKTDYGKAEGLPIFKDYTVVADREIVDGLIENADGGVATRGTSFNNGAFCFDFQNSVFSFGSGTSKEIDIKRVISYQSKYINNGLTIGAGNVVDTNPLCIARLGSTTNRYSKLALWSFLLFPYSLSEFLLERQLKRYKLGTLYPDMVEFRPIVKSNVEYSKLQFFYRSVEYPNVSSVEAVIGNYYPTDGTLLIRVFPNSLDEVSKISVNGKLYSITYDKGNNYYQVIIPISELKSPQKIDITIDEYIHYEDIVQPYPLVLTFKQENKVITYGDKLKVGSDLIVNGRYNLLVGLYQVGDKVQYNGADIKVPDTIKVAKSMVFTNFHIWQLNTIEPYCILSPQKLNIPNSSLKILGYVPDLTGKGNHGKLNNLAYAEDSGVAADGSIKLDGVDDHITIPTLAHGGKCVMMKVAWEHNNVILYDQRVVNTDSFALSVWGDIAYNYRNSGSTYIDGILNTNIAVNELQGIIHNITATNSLEDGNTTSPILGKESIYNRYYANMSLYEFMLFPEIPSEDEIKKLNDVMGIEGGYVESPNYYWDMYGKNNNNAFDIDGNKYFIPNQVQKQKGIAPTNAEALAPVNFAYDTESGYQGWLGVNNMSNAFTSKNLVTNKWGRGGTLIKGLSGANSASGCGYALASFYDANHTLLKFKVKISGLADEDTLYIAQYNQDTMIGQQLQNGINDVTLDISTGTAPTYTYITFRYSSLANDVDFEFLYEYQNGLVSDGVEDHLINTAIPAFTDFTVITKRIFIGNQTNYNAFCVKGDKVYSGGVGNAFAMEYHNTDGSFVNIIYGNSINNAITPPELISYLTPTNYNGKTMIKGAGSDNLGLLVGRANTTYWKGVFYKMMLYSKTIDQLSINMLKNLFERDELIDVTNPIFKK